MQTFEFNYKKDALNIYVVIFFVIIVSTALFLNTQKTLFMSFVYLGMGLITFISIKTHVRKSKTTIHTINFKDNLIIVNFKHTYIEPLILELSSLRTEILANSIILKDQSENFLIIIFLMDLKDKNEKDDLVSKF